MFVLCCKWLRSNPSCKEVLLGGNYNFEKKKKKKGERLPLREVRLFSKTRQITRGHCPQLQHFCLGLRCFSECPEDVTSGVLWSWAEVLMKGPCLCFILLVAERSLPGTRWEEGTGSWLNVSLILPDPPPAPIQLKNKWKTQNQGH